MKLILTSFAFDRSRQHQTANHENPSIFYRMPPVSLARKGEVTFPQYYSLLLCDKLVVDNTSFERLQSQNFPLPIYAEVSETLAVLHSEGFVETVDFSAILETKRDLLQHMVANDLRRMESWLPVLISSTHIWQQIAQELVGIDLDDESHVRNLPAHGTNVASSVLLYIASHAYGLETSKINVDEVIHSEQEVELRSALEKYLSYVNANILISSEIEAGIQDWADYLPFYEKKFTPEQKIPTTQRQVDSIQRLFTISFPEFAITDTKQLLRVLKDKRVVELRQLVQEAVDGRIIFDEKFAHNVFWEVLNLERESAKRQKIASYLTLPLDIIPAFGTLVAKATEEVVGKIIDRSLKKNYRWFYMLNDLTTT